MEATHAYKERLTEELALVTEELKTIGILNPDNPKDWEAIPEPAKAEPDENIAADRVEEWDERRAIVAELETRYNNITRALKKIESGTFGTCEICGETIEPDRLEVVPAARTCKVHREEEQNLPR